MKKIILIAAIALGTFKATAQTMSVTLEYKAVQDSFYVHCVPTFNYPGVFNFGPCQVTIVFSNNYGITVTPATSEIATTGINGGTWVAQDYALNPVSPNNKYVGFQTTGAPMAGGLTASTPVLLFRFRVTGLGGNCVSGAGTLRHYVNGTDPVIISGGDFSSVITDGLTTVEYFTTNSSTTMQNCGQLVLPVNLLDFNARRQEKNAIVNWQVSGEDFKTNYYELYRSVDGVNFNPIAKIAARQQPGIQQYEYIDANIAALAAKNVYYRVKQFDVDGRNTVSGIRYVRLDVDAKEIQVFPNPVKEGFYVSIPGTLTGKIKLNVVAADGRTIATREIGAAQAVNYYFDIKNKVIASGQYTLQIIENDKILSNKKMYINQ